MAFIANTAFEARITNGEFDALCNISGKFYASDVPADCSAGILCTRSALLPCEGFTGIDNENAWKMVAATASTDADTLVYAFDMYDAQKIANGTNKYYIGPQTLGLGLPAGEMGTFKRIHFDGDRRYRFGVGNLTTDLSTNGYLKPAADGKLAPAASAPTAAGSLYFEVVGTGTFTEGAWAGSGYVDVIAHAVVVGS